MARMNKLSLSMAFRKRAISLAAAPIHTASPRSER